MTATDRNQPINGGPIMPSIRQPSINQLAREWQEAQHVAKVIGGRDAAAAAEAARQALAEAAKQRRRERSVNKH